MTEEDRDALIPSPSGKIVKAGSGPERILSGMVTDALDMARSRDKSLTRARFRIGKYEFRDADYRQILLWADALKLEPAVTVQHLESCRCTYDDFTFIGYAAEVGFIVEDGAIATLAWDFKLLPITEFEWVDGLEIREMALYGAAAARLSLRLPLLNRLFCSGVAELDLSNVPALNCIECGDSLLAELDLSNVPELTHLNCSFTQLVELDLSNVPALVKLRCENNRLTKLDLSNVPDLRSLGCSNNDIVKLDLSNVPALVELMCDSCGLAELDLSPVPALEELWCGDNRLAEIDLSSTPALTHLFCGANRLTHLDLSSVPALVQLCCDSNQLAELNLWHLPVLAVLVCSSNDLADLDIRRQETLAYLTLDPSVRLKKLPTQNPQT